MAKKWVPQVGESYIVRGSDNGKTGRYIGVIYVKGVVGTPKKYRGGPSYDCSVYGDFLDRSGKFCPGVHWNVGKAGLIKDYIERID